MPVSKKLNGKHTPYSIAKVFCACYDNLKRANL